MKAKESVLQLSPAATDSGPLGMGLAAWGWSGRAGPRAVDGLESHRVFALLLQGPGSGSPTPTPSLRRHS